MRNPLTAENWAAVRAEWEYAPTTRSYFDASKRAAAKGGFVAPGRAAVCRRAKVENWQRRGLTDVAVSAAHAKADALVTGGLDAMVEKRALSPAQDDALARAALDEYTDEAGEILARHRREWALVGALVAEALAGRESDPVGSFNRCKIAKISAETIALRQIGERRAWGLDTPSMEDIERMSDENLERIASGRKPLL